MEYVQLSLSPQDVLAGLTSMALGSLRNLPYFLCFFPLAFLLRFRRAKGTGRLVVEKNFAIYRHTTLVIGIRIVHILTADRRDDGHICRVRASIGHCLTGVTVKNGRDGMIMDYYFQFL